MRRTSTCRIAAAAAITAIWIAAPAGQTTIRLPKNKYTPQQDVEIGREAAAQVRKQYPIITDERITRYLAGIGDRLVAAAPAELKESVYEFSFTPLNLKEINAFALPGGPMFVHRGMFNAASSEDEVAGVMAHELSHVLLRHGTANATKAQNPWLQLGQLAGAVGGAVVGGGVGSAIAQGSQFGLGTLLLRYSRDFEKQADLLGVQIMARAGYDPRALAHMFETIQQQTQGGDPQWLSSHPNPGNRTAYITKEAETLTVASHADVSGFEPAKAMFAALPPPKTMADVAHAASVSDEPSRAVGTPGRPVAPPSSQFHEITGGKVFRASVPSDWTTIPSKSSIKVVPQNGYGELNGQTVFTCGIEFGVSRPASRDLEQATTAWLRAIAQNNPDLRIAGSQTAVQISQRSALATPLANPSPLGGTEHIVAYTTFLADGTLFYYLTLVPETDAAAFEPTFQRIAQSIRLTEVR